MNNEVFNVEKSVEQAVDFQNKMLKGMANLMNMPKDDMNMDATPKELVYSQDKMKLYHYKPQVRKTKVCKVPLLITYALVNRQYMMDIQPDRSTIKGFLEEGLDVYIIDWGYPTASDKYLTMDDYINGYINDCVEFIKESNKVKQINMLGVCQGGTFSTIYAALYPENVKNLVTMVTPIDFSNDDTLLFAWSKNMNIDKLVDAYGLIPGDLMNFSFAMLKPFSLNIDKYIGLVDKMDDANFLENFMRMEIWINDSPDQVGETIRQFINDLYKENKLAKGELKIGGQKVDLKNIKCPLLNVYAEYDHLVPPSSSKPLNDLVSSTDTETISFGVGHIGMYVSSKSKKEITPKIATWILEHSK